MASARREEDRIAAKVMAELGVAETDPNDVAQQRTLYNANRAFWNEGGPP